MHTPPPHPSKKTPGLGLPFPGPIPVMTLTRSRSLNPGHDPDFPVNGNTSFSLYSEHLLLFQKDSSRVSTEIQKEDFMCPLLALILNSPSSEMIRRYLRLLGLCSSKKLLFEGENCCAISITAASVGIYKSDSRPYSDPLV